MTSLSPLPVSPPDVRYALTVPQSVTFADLSLRGSTRSVFRRALDADYEPRYIAIDNGAMSWNFTPSDPFVGVLSLGSEVDPVRVAQRFIDLMGRTSRSLVRKAQVLSPATRRRPGSRDDLLADLQDYWNAYEMHMTSLFTFWNVETLVTEALIEALRAEGDSTEINSGLPTFVRPSEPNWFAIEQASLLALKDRVGSKATPEAVAAAEDHVQRFGFLLAPFNLGDPPTAHMVLDRIRGLSAAASLRDAYEPVVGRSSAVESLGELERELTFWKTERLDAFALADSYMLPAYRDVAALLDLDIRTVFCMTRDEMTAALSGESPKVEEIEERSLGYCLALIDGNISFYAPTPVPDVQESDVAASGTVLRGTVTSPGVVVGRVRLVRPGEAPDLADDEVLVTQMTRPDMGAALDQAIAYVTDEGGRLSHAAIVSREKNKPCVTAVGNATQLLRPGMLIEVNGSEGTVTVLDASFLSDHP